MDIAEKVGLIGAVRDFLGTPTTEDKNYLPNLINLAYSLGRLDGFGTGKLENSAESLKMAEKGDPAGIYDSALKLKRQFDYKDI